MNQTNHAFRKQFAFPDDPVFKTYGWLLLAMTDRRLLPLSATFRSIISWHFPLDRWLFQRVADAPLSRFGARVMTMTWHWRCDPTIRSMDPCKHIIKLYFEISWFKSMPRHSSTMKKVAWLSGAGSEGRRIQNLWRAFASKRPGCLSSTSAISTRSTGTKSP
jgi:hypothetical protein